jgi:hypothetical protein
MNSCSFMAMTSVEIEADHCFNGATEVVGSESKHHHTRLQKYNGRLYTIGRLQLVPDRIYF